MSIKLTNDVKISSESLADSINVNDLLYHRNNGTEPITFTATKDCIVIFNISAYAGTLTIDGVSLIGEQSNILALNGCISLKKGQVFSMPNNSYKWATIYGLK